MNLVPAMVDLPAQTKVNRQVRTKFEIVLNENLRALQARSVLRTDIRRPLIDVAKQEIRILETSSRNGTSRPVCARATHGRIGRPLLRVLPRILHIARGFVAPGSGIVSIRQQFSAEVKNMFAADHGHDIGIVEEVFLVNRIGTWRQPRIGIGAGGLKSRKIIQLPKLPTQLSSISLAQRAIGEVVHLVRVADSELVHRGGADVPYVCDLGIIVVDVAVLATNRAVGNGTQSRVGIVPLGIRHCDAVLGGDIPIQPSEIPLYWRRNQLVIEPVVVWLSFASYKLPARNRSQEGRVTACRRKEHLLEFCRNWIELRSGDGVRAILAGKALSNRIGIPKGI